METGIVQGYMTYRIVDNKVLETLYFVEGNDAYQSEEQAPSTHFRANEWTKMTRSADWVRETGEFIGNYPRPVF